jgi:hypothetical protein
MQPFSSYPSQVEVHLDGKFHSFAGCAMEATAISRMPPLSTRDVTLESFCACCLAPITVVMADGALVRAAPQEPIIHVSLSPWDWGNPNIEAMCDSMNYVLDADHADAYERQTGRLGARFTIDQARRFVAGTADNRMWDHDWPPGTVDPKVIIRWVASLGVDVTPWGEEAR